METRSYSSGYYDTPAGPSREDRKKPLNYKDVSFLAKHLTAQGQIHSRKRTGYSTQRQKALKQSVKYARHLALLPFVG